MATPQERVVAKAKSQVGYIANCDKSNKFARQLDQLGVYNGPKDGFDWCDVFADWCFIDEFGVDVGMRMLNQPMHGGGAGCWLSAGYHRAAGQWSKLPQVGAQIYFGSYGDESHTGIVVGVTATTVTTVEGNTGYSEGYGGGAVLERTYSRDSSRIVGYGIPKWSLVDSPEQKPGEPMNDFGLHYRAHSQDVGWLAPVHDGQTAGITGHSLRCEAIKITPPEGVVLDAFAHVQDIGTLGYPGIRKGQGSGTGSSDTDPIIGTVGRSKRLEAVMLRCVENPTGKSLKVQAHVEGVGWQEPVGEGEWAGTLGNGKRLEAVRMWFE